LKGKIMEVLRVARPGVQLAAGEKTGTACRNAGSENEAALRQERHNTEAFAAVSAMRLMR
jgi:hypothetical protein